MATNSNALKAGVFIVAAAAVSLAVVVVVSGPDRFQAREEYVAAFDFDENIQGIRPGSEVRIAGVRVGTVDSVDIDDGSSTDPAAARPPLPPTSAPASAPAASAPAASAPRAPQVLVRISVPKKYTLRQGATVSVEALIGSANLNIDSFGTGGPLPPGGRLEGQPGILTTFAHVAPKIEAAVEEIRVTTIPKLNAAIDEYQALAKDAREKRLPEFAKVADDARAILIDVRGRIHPAVEAYLRVAEAARLAVTNVGDFVGPASGDASLDFRKVLGNLKDGTGTLKQELPAVIAKAKAVLDQLNDRLTQLKGTADDLRAAMADTREVTASVRAVLSDNRPRIDRIIAGIEGTATNAKAFTAEVLRRPSRLIWRDDARTQNNLDVYRTAREFAEGAGELNDAATSLREAVKDPRISDVELKRRIDALDTTFQRFNQVEDRLFKAVKE